MGVYQFARGSVSRDSSLVIGLYRQPLTTVSSAGAEGREACLLQPESPSALFTLITQHNIGHPTPQIKLHYIKETLDQRVILMHAHVKVVDRAAVLWPDLDRETRLKNSVCFLPVVLVHWQVLPNPNAVTAWGREQLVLCCSYFDDLCIHHFPSHSSSVIRKLPWVFVFFFWSWTNSYFESSFLILFYIAMSHCIDW